MKHLVKLAVASVFSILAFGAQATPTLTPIGSVTILGNAYNVSLLSDTSLQLQSFSALAPTITFTSSSDAQAAAAALLATFGNTYDWNPTCSVCADGFRVPFGTDGSTYDDWSGNIGGGPFGPFTGTPVDSDNSFSFAQFTLESSTIPEPGTLALFGLAMAGLGLVRTRKG